VVMRLLDLYLCVIIGGVIDQASVGGFEGVAA